MADLRVCGSSDLEDNFCRYKRKDEVELLLSKICARAKQQLDLDMGSNANAAPLAPAWVSWILSPTSASIASWPVILRCRRLTEDRGLMRRRT